VLEIKHEKCRTIYFTNPVVTNKVRLDLPSGARDIAFKIELLGLDIATRNQFDNPFQEKFMKTGTMQITDTNSVP
jgi:hypothetical protein